MKNKLILILFSGLVIMSVPIYLNNEFPHRTNLASVKIPEVNQMNIVEANNEEEVETIKIEESKPVNLVVEPITVHTVEVKEEPESYKDEDFVIVGLGDSLTAGIGDESRLGYVGHVKSLFETGDNDVKLVNFGVRGHDTGNLLKRLKDPSVQKAVANADMIFMTIGGNDIVKVVKKNLFHLDMSLFHKQEKVYIRNLTEILETVRALNQNTRIYYVGLFNPFYEVFPEIEETNEIIHNWNETSVEVLKNFSNTEFIPIIDLFERNTASLLAQDYFHPNQMGYQLIGERIGVFLNIGLPFFQTAER